MSKSLKKNKLDVAPRKQSFSLYHAIFIVLFTFPLVYFDVLTLNITEYPHFIIAYIILIACVSIGFFFVMKEVKTHLARIILLVVFLLMTYVVSTLLLIVFTPFFDYILIGESSNIFCTRTLAWIEKREGKNSQNAIRTNDYCNNHAMKP